MAATSNAAGPRKAQHDRERAARMKAEGVCRTTGRCAICYRMVTVDSWKSRYTHLCWR